MAHSPIGTRPEQFSATDTQSFHEPRITRKLTRKEARFRIDRRPRLGPVPKTKSVKMTFACPVSLKAGLDRYAALHAQTHGEQSMPRS